MLLRPGGLLGDTDLAGWPVPPALVAAASEGAGDDGAIRPCTG